MKYTVVALLVVSIVVVACDAQKSTSPSAMRMAATVPPGSGGKGSPVANIGRKLIRDVDLDLTVKEVESTSAKAQEIASEMGGYVASGNTTGGKQAVNCSLVLRVPAEKFEAVVGSLKKLAVRVNSEAMKAEDVTDKFVDLEARLKTLNLTEKEIQKLLEESRAREHKITDVMALYKELTEIRGQSEQIQGQLNVLSKLVDFSTIRLVLHPEETLIEGVQKRWHPSETVQKSWHALISTLQVFGDWLIMVVVYLVPVGIIVAIQVAMAMRVKKWFDLKVAKSKPPIPPTLDAQK